MERRTLQKFVLVIWDMFITTSSSYITEITLLTSNGKTTAVECVVEKNSPKTHPNSKLSKNEVVGDKRSRSRSLAARNEVRRIYVPTVRQGSITKS